MTHILIKINVIEWVEIKEHIKNYHHDILMQQVKIIGNTYSDFWKKRSNLFQNHFN